MGGIECSPREPQCLGFQETPPTSLSLLHHDRDPPSAAFVLAMLTAASLHERPYPFNSSTQMVANLLLRRATNPGSVASISTCPTKTPKSPGHA
jgi:hypothetical protein